MVIAIIGILAALLLPALAKAKAKGQAIACASNMKNWGYATVLYVGDFEDKIPFFGDNNTSLTGEFWHAKLAPYVARQVQPNTAFYQTYVWTNELRKCPGGDGGIPPYWSGLVGIGLPGDWNCWIGAHHGLNNRTLSGPFIYGILNGTPNPPVKSAQIRKPSQAMLFMDCAEHYVYSPVEPAWKFTLDLNGDGYPDSRSDVGVAFNWGRPTVHSGGANVTLLDGHVERVAFRKLWEVNASGNVVHPFWYMDGSH